MMTCFFIIPNSHHFLLHRTQPLLIFRSPSYTFHFPIHPSTYPPRTERNRLKAKTRIHKINKGVEASNLAEPPSHRVAGSHISTLSCKHQVGSCSCPWRIRLIDERHPPTPWVLRITDGNVGRSLSKKKKKGL